MRFDLSDEEWALLEPLLPKSRKSARVDDRKIVNAIFYALRTGMPWRDLPARYGPYTTAYNRFNRWSRRGIWKRVFDQLASKSRDSLYLIDSTVVKAHRAASGAKGGEKSGDRRQPGRSNHENPHGRRQQGSAAQLHGDWRTSARQPSRRRDADHTAISARDYRRQGLRQCKSTPADQRRRCFADHSEPLHRPQESLLSQALLPAAPQNRELLLPHQRLAAHRHPL